MPSRHFSDDLLRGHAVGTASEGASLAVACHAELCPTCFAAAAAHQSVLAALLEADVAAGAAPPAVVAAVRGRLLADLPPPPRQVAGHARAGAAKALPTDLPPLPAALAHQLESLPDPAWRRLMPGIRAIDLGIASAWRARLVAFHPGIPIPLHDHGGPEHTVVFSGGLDDAGGHLGRGDAATMMPGDTHHQRSSPGEPCVALIISEAPARPLTLAGRILKRITRS